jgi:hypothetical protein
LDLAVEAGAVVSAQTGLDWLFEAPAVLSAGLLTRTSGMLLGQRFPTLCPEEAHVRGL